MSRCSLRSPPSPMPIIGLGALVTTGCYARLSVLRFGWNAVGLCFVDRWQFRRRCWQVCSVEVVRAAVVNRGSVRCDCSGVGGRWLGLAAHCPRPPAPRRAGIANAHPLGTTPPLPMDCVVVGISGYLGILGCFLVVKNCISQFINPR